MSELPIGGNVDCSFSSVHRSVYFRPPYGFLKEVLDHSIRYVCPKTGSFSLVYWQYTVIKQVHTCWWWSSRRRRWIWIYESGTAQRIWQSPLLYAVDVYHTIRNKAERYVMYPMAISIIITCNILARSTTTRLLRWLCISHKWQWVQVNTRTKGNVDYWGGLSYPSWQTKNPRVIISQLHLSLYYM